MSRIRRWASLSLATGALVLSACSSINSPQGSAGSKQDKSDIPPIEVIQVFANGSTPVVISIPLVTNSSDSSQDPVNRSDARLVHALAERFHKPETLIQRVVAAATKSAHEGFPTRDDLLAIIAVESGFNPQAHYKGSHGLMQVQVSSHRKDLNGRRLGDVADNVALGSEILYGYYMTLGCNKRGAILAYNAGIGNYLMHRYKPTYYAKYRQQLAMIQEIQRS
jgi:hypothetical protein